MTRAMLIDAPSNLGLRPPAPGVVPGVYKLAGALRDQQLLSRLGAAEGGVVTPPRYEAEWEPGGARNGAAIARYSRRLADRVGAALDGGAFPLVLGGDCSILIGNMLALSRRGRHGLVFVDGHTDFRKPGHPEFGIAAAGEDMALVTGRGGELGRLVADEDVVVIGPRDDDAYRAEVEAAGIAVVTASQALERGMRAVAEQACRDLDRPFWIHCDADVLDASVMPAVDTPSPGGLDYGQIAELLGALLASEHAVGLELTIYDPDLDEDGALAGRLADCVCEAFASLH